MGPFIKDGSGNPSWTATALFLYLLFYFSCYYIGFFCDTQIAGYAQSAWSEVNVGLFGILTLYVTRRGTEVYERVKNGKGASVTDMMDLIGNVAKKAVAKKDDEPVDE